MIIIQSDTPVKCKPLHFIIQLILVKIFQSSLNNLSGHFPFKIEFQTKKLKFEVSIEID